MKHAPKDAPTPAPGPIDIFLQPGEYFVGDAAYRIRTLLGSCVSITLWHPVLHVGAMSHFLLASRSSGPSRGPGPGPGTSPDARYGDEAMDLMVSELRCAGVPLHECQAKIFGGGNMFPGQVRSHSGNVGQKNGEAAQSLLRAHRIPVISESLYGAGHRQIIFDLGSGAVWSRQVQPHDPLAPAAEQHK